MSDYKPTGLSLHPSYSLLLSNTIPEHDGLRQDGQPDKRVGTGGKSLQYLPFVTTMH
jgi:hypothetical protein